jgi:photosystem II stability/assembly factor-like uncharacterized protein
MTNQPDIQAALRASLAERARHAPPGGPVAERVIADVERVPAGSASTRRHDPRWRAWTLPLVAAGSVAAVAAALVGVNQFRHSASPNRPLAPATSQLPAPSRPAPKTSVVPSTPSPVSTTTIPVPGLTGVHVVDMTFVGVDNGWALGTADCLTGSGQPCTAMIRTTDGGRSWSSTPPPPANLPLPVCTDPCVQHLRFATSRIGYAFGPAALFMTTDGGATWQRQSGGADALETLDGNVIRVVTSAGCSPPGCHYSVQVAPLGAADWTSVALPGSQPGMSVGVAMARTGRMSFVEVFGHVSGGAQEAQSALFTSTDDGASWTNRGEPCPQVGGEISTEVDSTALATADDGSLTLICTGRGDQSPQFTITSTDGGRSFRTGDLQALGAAGISALGAASAATLIVSSDDTYRSTDGGHTWRRLHANGGSGPGLASWIGFESATVGRATDGRTIWTTRDAGLTWSAYSFR